jgi:hypothetical protein
VGKVEIARLRRTIASLGIIAGIAPMIGFGKARCPALSKTFPIAATKRFGIRRWPTFLYIEAGNLAAASSSTSSPTLKHTTGSAFWSERMRLFRMEGNSAISKGSWIFCETTSIWLLAEAVAALWPSRSVDGGG